MRLDPDMHPSELDSKEIVRLHQLLHEAKFKDPDGSHLSPAGQQALVAALMHCMHGAVHKASLIA